MPFYQKIIKGEYALATRKGMESWLSNCVKFISEVTGLNITYSVVSAIRGSTGFVVNIPIKISFINKFGIIMSTEAACSNYLSSILFNGEIYPLNSYGNFFDCSTFYESNVLVLYTDDVLHVLVRLPDDEYHTLFLVNKVTETDSGIERWGCLGFVPTDMGEAIFVRLCKNKYTENDGLSSEIKITNAESLDGRFVLNGLYSFCAPSICDLPEFMPFNLVFDNGEKQSAVILGSNTVNDSCGRVISSGRFIGYV